MRDDRSTAVLRIALMATATIALLSSCHRVRYSGDGVLSSKKAPVWFCQDEHDVNLGRVDMSKPGHERRMLAGLPAGEYIVGFAIRKRATETGLRDSVRGMRSPAPGITLSMANDRGEQLFSTSSRLADWTWSGGIDELDSAFVYKRGATSEVQTAPGTVRVDREGVGADGGWGTYFTARSKARYTLALDVDQPDADATMFDVDLEVRGNVGCL